MPFACLPDYIRRVKSGESLERPIEKLRAERQELIEDYRDLLTTDEDRAAYDQMITLAHRVFPYVEGHKFYCEHWYTNLFFNKIREFGALLAAHGFFPDAEDVFHLTHYELELAIIDLMTSWSNGSPPRGPGALAAASSPSGARRIGGVGEARDAAGARAGSGCHRRSGHRDALGHHPRESRRLAVSGQLARTATRSRASPPPAAWSKAPARIVKSVEEISRLQQGDILVCQITNPTWAPIFQTIVAAVSDIGGSMSHAAIVAREYGLPAVVGTGNATSRIKDGQRIRVDGGRGIVTILQ